MSSRYDIVVFGAAGYTGNSIVKTLATISLFKGKTIAVAGHDEEKLRATLEDIARETETFDVREYPIIVADSVADSETKDSLWSMARQAKVIINAVCHNASLSEAVVRAAMHNGASYVDNSAEPAFLERTEQRYGNSSAAKGVYIVGACGWDTMPGDLGVDYLKRHFDGTLAYVESCVRINKGPAGYTPNSSEFGNRLAVQTTRDVDAAVHHKTIVDSLPAVIYTPSWRCPVTKIRERSLDTWALPFPGAVKSIVERSQFYDFHMNGNRPAQVYTRIAIGSFLKSLLLACWLALMSFFGLFRRFRGCLAAHAECCSCGIFKADCPAPQQINETSFDYYFFGTGWEQAETPDKERPTKKVTAVCHGPDPLYACTSACACSAALALLDDKDKLPANGGVFTTASAFRHTHIYEYLRAMGVTFQLLTKREPHQFV